MLRSIGDFSKIPYNIHDHNIIFYGTNCIDFLSKVYEIQNKYRVERKYETFCQWLSWLPECFVYKTDVNAVLPSKHKGSDVGYDLTVIKEAKKLGNLVTLYDTGIKIKVQNGYYGEVVPRSSLSKSGYMLANCVGIIDPSYNGNIFIALIKIDENAPDIELPFRCCQLIIRPQVHADIIEVAEDFEETARQGGGFGSSG